MNSKLSIKKGICFNKTLVRKIRKAGKAEGFSFGKTVRILIQIGLEQTDKFAKTFGLLQTTKSK